MRCSHLEDGAIAKHADLTIKVVPPEQNTTSYREDTQAELCVFCSGYLRATAHNAAENRIHTFAPGKYTRKELHALIDSAARILRKGDVPTTRSEDDSLSMLELWLLDPNELRDAKPAP